MSNRRVESGGGGRAETPQQVESSQCTIVLPEECLGYGLVVPFFACRFASLVSNKMKKTDLELVEMISTQSRASLNSEKQKFSPWFCRRP